MIATNIIIGKGVLIYFSSSIMKIIIGKGILIFFNSVSIMYFSKMYMYRSIKPGPSSTGMA